MAVNVNEIIRVSARFKNDLSGDVVNVWHLQGTGSGFPLADSDVFDAIEAWLDAAWTNLVTVVAAGNDPYDIRADIVTYTGGREVVSHTLGTRTWTLTNPPNGGTDSTPQQVAAILNFRTGATRVFGRKYIGPLTENNTGNGTIVAGTVTLLADFATDILAGFVMSGTANFKVGVLATKPGIAGTFVAFTAAVINNILGIQRRRRIQRGS